MLLNRGDHGDGRGGCFNVRGLGRVYGGRGGRVRGGHVIGGRGGGISAHENGIEISDITRYFEDSEWAAISNDTRKSIAEDPIRTKFLENKKRSTTRSINAEKYKYSRLISQIITGVKNASRNEY